MGRVARIGREYMPIQISDKHYEQGRGAYRVQSSRLVLGLYQLNGTVPAQDPDDAITQGFRK